MESVDPGLENPLAVLLGPLEQQLHRAVWERGTATVREVLQDKTIWQTYNTVMTTMDRLFRKGLLARILEGKAFRYYARCSPEEFDRRTAVSGLRRLLHSENASLHLSYFVEAVGAEDLKLLDELQILVERQRTELLLKKGES
jgi:predicted transcriptional regulator